LRITSLPFRPEANTKPTISCALGGSRLRYWLCPSLKRPSIDGGLLSLYFRLSLFPNPCMVTTRVSVSSHLSLTMNFLEPVITKFSLSHHPGPESPSCESPKYSGYCQCLMYGGLCSLDTLHKITCWIGPGLCIMLGGNFREFFTCEVRRITIPRTRVNKG
jgi:hypothetical protein